MDSTSRSDTSSGSFYYSPQKFIPHSSERICCVELMNNNKIYIRFQVYTTVKDLIKAIINHNEFKTIYPSRNWLINTEDNIDLFELELALYRNVKENCENRLDYSFKIEELREKGLLKNHSHPFFIFKDNRAEGLYPYSSTESREKLLKSIIDANGDLYGVYSSYLPRYNTVNITIAHPELMRYFKGNKRPFNEVSSFMMNKLISEDENLDWFIYDDESMNFLMEMTKLKIAIKTKMMYINNKIYLEDKCESQNLTEKDLSNFFVKVSFISEMDGKMSNIFTQKIKINTKTTAFDILVNMNKKVTQKLEELAFDPKRKILRVRSLNDYIFNIEDTMVSYTYINECVKESKDAEYYIIDNPLLNESNVQNEETIILGEGNDNNGFTFGKESFKEKLFNIAVHKPSLDNTDSNMINPISYLNRGVDNNINNNNTNNNNDNLFKFVSTIVNDVNTKIKESYNDCINHKGSTHIRLSQKKKFYEKDIRVINKKFQMSDNNVSISLNDTLFRVQKGKKNMENIYTKCEGEQLDFIKLFKEKTSEIDIKEIERPFSLVIRSLTLKESLNSYPFDKHHLSVIIIQIQLLNGRKEFSNSKVIKWINKTQDLNPLFNKRIYFDIDYNKLSNFCSVLFKLKLIEYNKDYQTTKYKTFAWTNFRLFDHNKRLQTGKHKLNLWERPFNDDSYFCYTSCNEDIGNSIYFEIDSFGNAVVNKIVRIKNYKLSQNSLIISQTDTLKLNEIMEKTPFEELNNYDSEILWSNRYSVAKISTIVPRLLSCYNYYDSKHLIELEKIFELAKELSPLRALELLGGNFLHESIRNFAVRCIKKATWVEVQNYLLQLVQGLKYEIDHDSELARFILTMAINYPLSIGHRLFWSLRSEMFNQDVQQRFGLYLEVFLSKIGPALAKIFYDEDYLIKKLLQISDIPKNSWLSKSEQQREFEKALNALNDELRESKNEISIPLNFKFRIVGLSVKNCKIMKSKKKPLWLVFTNEDKFGENIVVMFKKGDDLRMDLVTLQLFKVMQTLWFENSLKLKMSIYSVICTGANQGMLEMVKDSQTLAEIHKNEGGAIHSFFSTKMLKNWIENNVNLPKEEYIDNFLLSSVAYCAATFVLGIGDRHNDNIMIKNNGELFHIDFGHFLGHFKYKLGIKRERAPFVFTKQFQMVLDGEKQFNEFKKKLWQAYQILRKNNEVLVTLLRILICTGIPELDEKSITFLEGSLALNLNDEEAKKYLEDKLEKSINSVSTKVNFAIHIVANK